MFRGIKKEIIRILRDRKSTGVVLDPPKKLYGLFFRKKKLIGLIDEKKFLVKLQAD